MKHFQFIAVIFFFSVASFGMGFLAHQPKTVVVETSPSFGSVEDDLVAELAKSQVLRQKIVIANERLKGEFGIDLSYGTPQQWLQASIEVAEDMEIEINPNADFNAIASLIRTNLGQQSMLCNNPNSSAFDPKDPNVANP